MKKSSTSPKLIELPFHSLRNISSPEDILEGRSVYTGTMPVQSIVDLPTNENVRNYLVEAEGKKKRVLSQVHLAIRNTLTEYPDRFCVLNGGVVLVAQASEVEDKSKTLRLLAPSIINGSQTQGVIRDLLNDPKRQDIGLDCHVKFELIVTDDSDLVAEISIARNFQNDVKIISIVGRRGYLDELEDKLQETHSHFKLQKSETELPSESNSYLNTEKLLQVIAALLPAELWWKSGEPNKVYTYSRKAACLKDFQTIYEAAHDSTASNHDQLARVYGFYLDIAGQAWDLYTEWRSHQVFAGSGLRALVRDESGAIVEVPDGIVFPILASLSEFVIERNGAWEVDIPKQLNDRELMQTAKNAYMEIANSNPNVMGKNKACYTTIQQITSIYRKFRDAS